MRLERRLGRATATPFDAWRTELAHNNGDDDVVFFIGVTSAKVAARRTTSSSPPSDRSAPTSASAVAKNI